MGARCGLALAVLTAGLGACRGAPPTAGRPPAGPLPGGGAAPSRPGAIASAAQAFADGEPPQVFADPDRRKKLEGAFPALDAVVDAELRARGLPGLVLGVIVDGELAHAQGFGLADLDTKATLGPDTGFRVASLSKSFVALSVLALRDDGELGLDDPLTRFVPEAQGLVYPTSDAPQITLRQLLTHTSGLPRDLELARPSEEELARALTGLALERVPGTRFAYSNLGFNLLGLVVGRASHSSLRAFVGARILGPLGMTSTGWDPAPSAADAGAPDGVDRSLLVGLATPYRRKPSGGLEPAPLQRFGLEGAGGLRSTVRDLARYAAFQLAAYPPRNAPDPGPLPRSTVREGHFNALQASGGLSVQLRDAPAKGESVVTAHAVGYGLGWQVEETCDFDPLVWHTGGTAGFASALNLLPEQGVGLVMLTNFSHPTFELEDLARKALVALKRGGGLTKRVRLVKLAPGFDAAMARFLAVYNAWDERAYRAMLSARRAQVAPEDERDELAGYRGLHGACKGYAPLEVLAPFEARVAMTCERGALEMRVQLDPSDGLLTHFVGTSRDVPAPPALAHVAGRLAGLIGKWDEAVYRKHLVPGSARTRGDTVGVFDALRELHGACSVRSYTRWDQGQAFTLGCERGGDVKLTLALDARRPEVVVSYALATEGGGVCPVR